MKRLATFAAALAVAAASPVMPAAGAATSTTTLAPDESPSALLTASAAVAAARDDAAALAAKRPLKPGSYWWAPDAPTSGEVEVIVSLDDQRAYVYRAGQLIGISTVSTGKTGKETPAGIFPILEKKRTHFSRKYDNAPMPFMQRLDRWGIALHAGAIPGYRASRGCVRLPTAFASRLFTMTDVGDRVVIG
jgi:lipoprotein-anchoring transpeptidase ErfK/SrfK